MKRSDSLEVKACCKIAWSRDVPEEQLERSRLSARLCWGTGTGTGRRELPCSLQPINPSLLRSRTFPLQAAETYVQEAGGAHSRSIGAAAWLRLAAAAMEDPGSQRDPALPHQHLGLAGNKGEAAAANPSLQRGRPGVSGLAAGQRDSGRPHRTTN